MPITLTFATAGWRTVSTELAGQETTVKGAFYRSEPPDLYVPPTHPGQTFRPSAFPALGAGRSEEHTSELQSLMRISYAVFCLKKKNKNRHHHLHYRNSNT